MAGLQGASLDKDAEDLILNHHVGGFILFGRNFENPRQLAGFINDLQALALSQPDGAPLFISVDQEGGRVARLKEPFTAYPCAGVLGIAKSEALAYKFGRSLAGELSAVGINMDFAPVLDVNSNPANPVIGDRAFSDDPEWVARLGSAFVRAFNDNGILPVGKHFPGHGDTSLDSHLEMPYVKRDARSLENVELFPFGQVFKKGLDAIMTAHVIYPAWDDKYPATFSEAILGKIPRKKLGFEGIIISDDLEMKAVADNFSLESIPALGIQAGLDVFLVCHDTDKIRTLHDLMVKGVEGGGISKESIRRSSRRIAEIKGRIKTVTAPSPDDFFNAPERQIVAEEMKSYIPT